MRALLMLGLLALGTPVRAQTELQDGFAGALRGCEEWVLNPSSWATGLGPFVSAVGLGDKMGAVDKVDEAALPPQQLRRANHFWRIRRWLYPGGLRPASDVPHHRGRRHGPAAHRSVRSRFERLQEPVGSCRGGNARRHGFN